MKRTVLGVVAVGMVAGLCVGARSALSQADSLKEWQDGELLTSTDLNANFRAIQNRINALVSAPDAPIAVKEYASATWGDYKPAIWPDPSYYKDRSGTVFLRGLILRDPKLPKATAEETLFILPPECRPDKQEVVLALAHEPVSDGHFACRIDVTNKGEVIVHKTCAPTANWISLSGINFRAAR